MFVFTEDIQIFSWGRADYGQLGLGDDVVQQGFCSEPTEVTHVRGAKEVSGQFIWFIVTWRLTGKVALPAHSLRLAHVQLTTFCLYVCLAGWLAFLLTELLTNGLMDWPIDWLSV